MSKKLPVIISPVGTAAYAWLDKPDDKFNKDKPSYKVTLVLDDDDETAAFIDAIKTQGQETAGRLGITKVAKAKSPKMPVENGSERNEKLVENEREAKPEWEGKILVTFKSGFAPTCLIPTDLPSDTVIMSGDRIKVKAKVNPYEAFGGGISLRLTAVKLIEKVAGGDGDWGDDDDQDYVKAEAKARRTSDDAEEDEDHGDY